MKHTEGPWKAVYLEGSNDATIEAYEYEIGLVYNVGCGDLDLAKEARANAQLVARAPELLAALKIIADACKDTPGAPTKNGATVHIGYKSLQQIRKAIKGL